MKRSGRHLLKLVLPLVLALLLCACEKGGELRIRNRTASTVFVSVDTNEPFHLDAWSNWSKFYAVDRMATISYSGDYVFSNSITREVLTNLVTTVDISPDGGAIRLLNDVPDTITEVYISPAGDPDWGPDDLAGVLPQGTSTLWTITEGSWDIRVVGDNAVSHYLYEQPVVLNSTLSLSYSSFAKSASNADTRGQGNHLSDNNTKHIKHKETP